MWPLYQVFGYAVERGAIMRVPTWDTGVSSPGRMPALSLLQGATFAFIAGAAVFLTNPSLDIAAASWFYSPHHAFLGRTPSVELVRNAFKGLYIGAVVLTIAGVYFAYWHRLKLMGLCSLRWLVVGLTITIGPGIIANVLLKDQMGRARPLQTDIFGGNKTFTPALVPASECKKNCSFVSGEAASMFAVFFGFAVVAGPLARRYVVTGLIAGGAVGLIRMSQGAHFLSDVFFAAVFMAMTAAVLRLLLIDMRSSLTTRTHGAVHDGVSS